MFGCSLSLLCHRLLPVMVPLVVINKDNSTWEILKSGFIL